MAGGSAPSFRGDILSPRSPLHQRAANDYVATMKAPRSCLAVAGCFVAMAFLASADGAESDFAAARARMVAEQLASPERGITNRRVLKAMGEVPRHEFVPAELRSLAYTDRPLPIGHDQTISQPYIVAFMTEQLAPKPTDRVLEIGTGSGYQAAVLARLVAEVSARAARS